MYPKELLDSASMLELFRIYRISARRFFLAGLLCLMCAHSGLAQSREERLPSFDVASIRANHSGNYSMSISVDPPRFKGKEITTGTLLTLGFQVNDFQILGAPGWAQSERYTVDAKMPDTTRNLPDSQLEKQIALMVRSLLSDRYRLKYHRAIQIRPVYSLKLSKNGPKLQNAKPDEATFESISNNVMIAHAYTMDDLAKQLSLDLHRTVQNDTGLTGKYTFSLDYEPDRSPTASPASRSDADLDTQARLLSALQESLGLKLVSQKGPVEVIVIDRLDRPSEN